MTQENKTFWKEMWELKIKIFGKPTLEDIRDGFATNTLPAGNYETTDGTNIIWFVNADQI
jgi:hypothetical protein